jgi:hypothetical protein
MCRVFFTKFKLRVGRKKIGVDNLSEGIKVCIRDSQEARGEGGGQDALGADHSVIYYSPNVLSDPGTLSRVEKLGPFLVFSCLLLPRCDCL